MNKIVFNMSSDVASVVFDKDQVFSMIEDGVYTVSVFTKNLKEATIHGDVSMSITEKLPKDLGEVITNKRIMVTFWDDNYRYTLSSDNNITVYFKRNKYNTPEFNVVVNSDVVFFEKYKISDETKENLKQIRMEANKNNTFIR